MCIEHYTKAVVVSFRKSLIKAGEATNGTDSYQAD
jgi:hypothetical protein